MKDSIFNFCVRFLVKVAQATGLSYKQASVIVNIYIQGGILMLSAFLPLTAVLLSARHLSVTRLVVFLLLSGLYAILSFRFFRILCRRYGRRPLESSFDRCVHDLDSISDATGISYKMLNILIFICGWCLLIAVNALPLLMRSKDNANPCISSQETTIHSNTSANGCLVERTDTCGLMLLYPKFSKIDLACGTMPSQHDSQVLLCAEACFTGTCSKTFDHRNIAGDHVSGGHFYKGFRCKRNTGAFTYAKGEWKFHYGNYSRQMKSAAEQGGAAFAQETIIHLGKTVCTKRKDSNCNQFRALCEIKGKLCIAESKTIVTFGEFKHSLLQAGATEALYLDMGAGWNHAWYRTDASTVVVLHPRTHEYCTNWITFYR